MNTVQIKLEPGKTYHLFNRGNNREHLFYRQENYPYFLKKYEFYLSPYVDTLAYCLMSNHFHLLVRIKAVIDFPSLKDLENLKSRKLTNLDPEKIVSEQFRLFFMAYSKAINKQQRREGSLFRKYFRRKPVLDNGHLLNAVCYIHRNPVHHGFTDIFTDYRWTSYAAILSDEPSVVCRETVLQAFGGRRKFIDFHRRAANLPGLSNLEDF
jgi:REP element-mobilizing transposase RayT